ncbi:hypothetical protein [Streptomyces sp. NBC_00443]|uniref:hypothetical protein n=1 Tax=Streptomyces sp. NBC_00443 TaxID=2975743 RepID=UPI002E2378EE
MPSRSRPHGPLQRARTRVNAAIRRLIDEPPSPQRTDRYERLLAQWRELHEDDYTPAA